MILFRLSDIIKSILFVRMYTDLNKDQKAKMEYLAITQTAEKWGISRRHTQYLCSERRISGVTKNGSYWAVPTDAAKPTDARIKSGKYIKNNMPEDEAFTNKAEKGE